MTCFLIAVSLALASLLLYPFLMVGLYFWQKTHKDDHLFQKINEFLQEEREKAGK